MPLIYCSVGFFSQSATQMHPCHLHICMQDKLTITSFSGCASRISTPSPNLPQAGTQCFLVVCVKGLPTHDCFKVESVFFTRALSRTFVCHHACFGFLPTPVFAGDKKQAASLLLQRGQSASRKKFHNPLSTSEKNSQIGLLISLYCCSIYHRKMHK